MEANKKKMFMTCGYLILEKKIIFFASIQCMRCGMTQDVDLQIYQLMHKIAIICNTANTVIIMDNNSLITSLDSDAWGVD